MNKEYEQFIVRKKNEYGERFSDKDLAPQFIPYFKTKVSIKVKWGNEVLTGTVGVTTGWVPTFILMRNSRALGSSITLGRNAKVIGIKYPGERKYRAV